MWVRRCRGLAGLGMVLSLGACATHPAAPGVAGHPGATPVGERDATGAYRFNMTQDGRRMSADEFDAWMKARGIRVARGAPNAAPAARATAQARPKAKVMSKKAAVASAKPAKPGSTKVVGGKPAPTAVASAKAAPATLSPSARPVRGRCG